MGYQSKRNKIYPVHINTKTNILPSPQRPPTNCSKHPIPGSAPRLTINLGNSHPPQAPQLKQPLPPITLPLYLSFKNKHFIYKMLLKPIWFYGLQLWGASKPPNINKIRNFMYKCLWQTTKSPYYVSNDTLDKDLFIPTILNKAKIFYKRLHSSTHNHRNQQIAEPSTYVIPRDPKIRVNQTWCRELLAH